ncbi:MAG TPA: glucodextranase DOMON-like domain-containing protein [Chitinophagaceae bacterium]|nr:glucodextranase DOMON-like domain-containing protein [Chitinophagaceae bacterium]
MFIKKKMQRLFFTMLVTAFSGIYFAAAQKIVLKDPEGDDNGPGSYVYPTDAVYKKGSFDIRELVIEKRNPGKLEISVAVNSTLEDPWKYGMGFCLQMLFLFIDTDQQANSGFTKAPPGLNVVFSPKDAWDKCIILSPQTPQRIVSEIKIKAPDMSSALLIPSRTRGSGRKILATVSWPDDIDISKCSFQLVMQANEGFPTGNALLTRPVNEYEGQHRFGGGDDGDCDPHILDVLAGNAKGEEEEKKAQYTMLSYECGPDGSARKTATLQMIRPAAPR